MKYCVSLYYLSKNFYREVHHNLFWSELFTPYQRILRGDVTTLIFLAFRSISKA